MNLRVKVSGGVATATSSYAFLGIERGCRPSYAGSSIMKPLRHYPGVQKNMRIDVVTDT
jgi:hypothetical protein